MQSYGKATLAVDKADEMAKSRSQGAQEDTKAMGSSPILVILGFLFL